MRTKRRLFGIVAALLPGSFLLLWGCLSEVRVHDIGSSHRAALHGVHAERLKQEMAAIDRNYRKAQRLPIRRMKERGFRQMEHCAEQVAVYASALPEVTGLEKLSPDARATFERLADQLKANAESLKAAAARKDRAEVREMFSRMTSTCNACHAAFRESSNITHDGGWR